MAEENVKGLEKQPKRDEESDRDAASRTAPNQVSTVLMQGVLTTPRPLCFEGDGARNWHTWRQMWDAYATVSRIYKQSDEYQLATFIMCLGEAAVEVYNALSFNNEADRRSLAAVLSKMEQHFIGAMNVRYERFVFRTRTQGQGETFEQYLLTLRTLVKTYNFQAMSEDMIRDQTVCGITKESLRKSLLEQKDLSLSVCIDICRAAKRSAQQSKVMGGHEEVHAMRQSARRTSMPQAKPKASKKTCGYCEQQHVKGKCQAYGHECTACGKKNHYAGVCRSMKRTTVNWTEQESDVESEHLMTLTLTEEINALQHSVFPKQLFEYMEVEGQRVRFQLDLGASCNVIDDKIWYPHWSLRRQTKCSTTGVN